MARALPDWSAHRQGGLVSWLGSFSGCQHAADLAEDGADAGGDTRHDSAGGDGHETCHQSVFDEVLTACILPNFQLQNEIRNPCHLLLLFLATDYPCQLLVVSYHRPTIR